jgi:hypothetical protein
VRDPYTYTMLISGLPRPEALFRAKRPPLSRLKLDRRLRVLTPEDAEVLKLVENTLTWRELPITITDDEVVARARVALERIDNEPLRLIIRDRLEIRTCVAALRRRDSGKPAPAPGTRWGYGRWVSHIVRHWNETTFGLNRVFPWLREADNLLKAGEAMALHRLILDQAWKNLGRHAGEHEFDFEAVVIYVLKWDIVDRWSRRDSGAAAKRFQEMTDTGLGNYADLFAGEQPG